MKHTHTPSLILVVCISTLIATAAEPTPQELPETTITARPPGYSPGDASTATKTDTPIKDLPASVQVVPKELLQDRGVTRIEQIAETVSGVHAEPSYGENGATFFNVRGFTTSNALRDGFRNYGYLANRDLQAVERVEILKGPAGALYGASGSLGGFINTISKRPQPGTFGELGLTLGSYGLLRPTLDFNAPLGGGVTARLNLAYEHNDTFRDQGGYYSFSIAPALRWDVNEDTSLTLLMEYNRLEREGFDFGIPNVPQYRQLSRSRYHGLTSDYGDNDTYAGTLIFEHRLSDEWKLRIAGHASYSNQISNQTFPDLGAYTGGTRVPFFTYFASDEDSADYAVQAELLGKFATGAIQHNALFGVELSRVQHGFGSANYYGFDLDLRDAGFRSAFGPKQSYADGKAEGDALGIYLQDMIELTPQIKILGGLRADWFQNRVYDAGQKTGEADEQHFSPRAGIVWQPLPTTSLYASWSRSFAPNIGHSVSSSLFSAEEGEQFELGIKQDLIRDRLNATFSAFDLTRTGILTTDPTNPLKQIQTGEKRSWGIEFDLGGEPLPGWKITASYAYTDTEVVSDTFLPVGQPLSNVPRNSGSLWSTYQVQTGKLKGLGVGLYYTGQREANLPNTYDLPAYWRTDATVFYERENWKAQINVLNVFDRQYYTGGETGVFNYTLNPSQPFSVQASVSFKF